MATAQGIVTRLCILVVSVFFGLILSFPMMMMSDSGSTLAIIFSTIGVLGCLLLIIGGIVGAVRKQWRALVPGTVLVLTALTPAVPPFAIVSILLVYCCCWKKQTDEDTELLIDQKNSDKIDCGIYVQERTYNDDSFQEDDTMKVPV
jgi:hypothetical protein